MNEKIIELYRQANRYASEAGFMKYDKAGNVNWKREDIVFEKFAELIVQECLKMCKTAVGNKDYNTGRMHCYDNIKEHFGVEE